MAFNRNESNQQYANDNNNNLITESALANNLPAQSDIAQLAGGLDFNTQTLKVLINIDNKKNLPTSSFVYIIKDLLNQVAMDGDKLILNLDKSVDYHTCTSMVSILDRINGNYLTEEYQLKVACRFKKLKRIEMHFLDENKNNKSKFVIIIAAIQYIINMAIKNQQLHAYYKSCTRIDKKLLITQTLHDLNYASNYNYVSRQENNNLNSTVQNNTTKMAPDYSSLLNAIPSGEVSEKVSTFLSANSMFASTIVSRQASSDPFAVSLEEAEKQYNEYTNSNK